MVVCNMDKGYVGQWHFDCDSGGRQLGCRFDYFFQQVSYLAFSRRIALNGATAPTSDDQKIVAALDTRYQAAVQKNDAVTMDQILADDFVLVTGSGKTYSKADLLREARSGKMVYERQEDKSQTVRVWGETAIVTAKLWPKGTEGGTAFEYTLWFSDTYVRTPSGWRYVFGQASLPLPKTPQ